MRRFADLSINPPLDDEKTLDHMASLSKMFGSSLVGIVFDRNSTRDQIDEIIKKFNEFGIDVAKRIDLSPRTRIELLKDLRKLRGRFEIISVKCMNTKVSVVAARDRRVDIVSIGQETSMRYLRRVINRIVNKSIEIKLTEILSVLLPKKIIFRRLHEEVFFAKENKVPIIISSGAKNGLMLRSPRDMATLGVLFGLEEDQALESVSKIPLSIVETNRAKLSPNWVSDGVKIVRVPKK